MSISAKNPQKHLAAVCGLFCPACSIYIASHEDTPRLQAIAARHGYPPEEARCEGCRSEKRYPYCATCKIYACAAEKGIDFCGACVEFPCQDLRDFQSIRAHRIELFDSLERISAAGYETWYREAWEHYACPQCGTLNSAYYPRCRTCDAEPANAYNARHQEEISRLIEQAGRSTSP